MTLHRTALALAALPIAILAAGAAAAPVTNDIVWQPGMSMMHELRDRCRQPGLVQCFADGMQAYGAPAPPVAFSRSLPNAGFARDFRSAGPVAIAYVDYPYRANENQVWLIVNGKPPMIDVDGLPYGQLDGNDPRLRAINAGGATVMVFPGDRNGTVGPQVQPRADGGVTLSVEYQLRAGCHACVIVGMMRRSFMFDRSGRLTGAPVTAIEPR